MRRIGLAIAALLLMLGAAACRCPMAMETLDRLESSVQRQQGLYLRYVEADPKLTEEQREIERQNVRSQNLVIGTIRDAHK
jgi:hypothetical protein